MIKKSVYNGGTGIWECPDCSATAVRRADGSVACAGCMISLDYAGPALSLAERESAYPIPGITYRRPPKVDS